MNDVLKVADEILGKIKLLEKMQIEIRERAENKAVKNAEYDKQIAVVIMKLKNGQEMILDDEVIQSPPATLIEKIARGICWKERLEADKAEALYKSIISNIDCTMAQLNGLQSLNRYLDKV